MQSPGHSDRLDYLISDTVLDLLMSLIGDWGICPCVGVLVSSFN